MCASVLGGGLNGTQITVTFRMPFKDEAKYEENLEEGKVRAKWRIR